jgi:broad specificity phosphatase PhoE
VQGQEDPVLTPLGREQAARAADALPAGVDSVLCSDLRRAQQTAEIIAGRYGLTVIPDERLREQGLGVLEGLLLDDALSASAGHDWTDLDAVVDGGESLRMVYDRLVPLGRELVAGRHGRTVVVVSHGDTIRVARCALTGRPPDEITADSVVNGEIIALKIEAVDDHRLDR